jgi:hypothetical protein
MLIIRDTGIAPHGLAETNGAGWVLLVGGGVLSLAGVVVVAVRSVRPRPQPSVEIPWPVAS